ncbi:unnamed protein product [Ixodes persulcatus]
MTRFCIFYVTTYTFRTSGKMCVRRFKEPQFSLLQLDHHLGLASKQSRCEKMSADIVRPMKTSYFTSKVLCSLDEVYDANTRQHSRFPCKCSHKQSIFCCSSRAAFLSGVVFTTSLRK